MSSSSSQLFSLGHFNLERQTAATFSSSQVEIYKGAGSCDRRIKQKHCSLWDIKLHYRLTTNNQPQRADSPDPRTLKQKRFTDEDVRVAETFVL